MNTYCFTFDDEDMRLCWDEANWRYLNARRLKLRDNQKDISQDGFHIMYVGTLCELATCKFFYLPPSAAFTRGGKVSGSIDLILYNGLRVDVKGSEHYKCGLAIAQKEVDPNVDVYICVERHGRFFMVKGWVDNGLAMSERYTRTGNDGKPYQLVPERDLYPMDLMAIWEGNLFYGR